jgi:hypothetical protein
MWHEATAGRGSEQSAYCVHKKIMALLSSTVHLIIYSDTSGGQNRNMNHGNNDGYSYSKPSFVRGY